MAVEVAKGIHNHPHFKLGSIVGKGLEDKRTVRFADFIGKDVQVPKSWDFDKDRKPFPSHMWGNDDYGDCEIAGRSNYLLRLSRAQTRTTPALTDDDCINMYKAMTGCVSPGDANDTGLYTLQNLRQWRQGWTLTKVWTKGAKEATRTYKIAAFGYIDPKDSHLMRTASYLFDGLLLGVNLPIIAQQQINDRVFDVAPSAPSYETEPGGWGGHCMYTKRFDANNIHALTWKRQVRCTNDWMNMYCDEAWAVIDDFEKWGSHSHLFNVQALIDEMKNAGITVQQ